MKEETNIGMEQTTAAEGRQKCREERTEKSSSLRRVRRAGRKGEVLGKRNEFQNTNQSNMKEQGERLSK